jgi:hypothetical protein
MKVGFFFVIVRMIPYSITNSFTLRTPCATPMMKYVPARKVETSIVAVISVGTMR